MSAPRVHVHINAIALRGFAVADANGIVAGLRSELARLLADAAQDGGFKTGRSVAVVSGGRLRRQAGEAVSSVGRTAAERIAGSLRS